MTKRKLAPRTQEPFETACTRLPVSIMDYIRYTADRQLRTRSNVICSLVIEGLRAQGIVMTVAELDAAEAEAP